MTIHRLKTWPEYFLAVMSKKKTFEVRRNDRDYDRDFKVGDTLILEEYDPIPETYTGQYIKCRVVYILSGAHAVPGYCIMGIK